jgi:hypothetical protein
MTDLVACLGTGKGTWGGVLKLVGKAEFENIFLIVNEWTTKNLQLDRKDVQLVIINSDDRATIIRDTIISQMHGKIKGFEVAVNMDSGTGKEHTAMITALMKLGLAFRFVVAEGDKVEEVSFSLSTE